MSPTRTCEQCGKHLITHRADARFCGEHCRARYNNKRRAEGAATDIRIAGERSGVGSRGGNVRSVQEARETQEASKEKARWTLIIREHLGRTLAETGFFHADDVTPLGVPERHCNLIGSQIASFVNRKLMQKVGERKCQHKAANGRKAAIYQITPKGKQELSGVGAGPYGVGASVRASADPGEQQAAGVDVGPNCRTGSGHSLPSASAAGVHSGGSSGERASAQGDDAALSSAFPEPARQLREGRDRQVRGAGSDEDRDASAGNGQPIRQVTAEAQPARLFEDTTPSAFDPWSEAA